MTLFAGHKCPKQVTIPHRSAIIALKNKSIAYGTTHISGVARIFMLLLASLCFKVSSRRICRSSPVNHFENTSRRSDSGRC